MRRKQRRDGVGELRFQPMRRRTARSDDYTTRRRRRRRQRSTANPSAAASTGREAYRFSGSACARDDRAADERARECERARESDRGERASEYRAGRVKITATKTRRGVAATRVVAVRRRRARVSVLRARARARLYRVGASTSLADAARRRYRPPRRNIITILITALHRRAPGETITGPGPRVHAVCCTYTHPHIYTPHQHRRRVVLFFSSS